MILHVLCNKDNSKLHNRCFVPRNSVRDRRQGAGTLSQTPPAGLSDANRKAEHAGKPENVWRRLLDVPLNYRYNTSDMRHMEMHFA